MSLMMRPAAVAASGTCRTRLNSRLVHKQDSSNTMPTRTLAFHLTGRQAQRSDGSGARSKGDTTGDSSLR